jgi:hypothetical protein
MARLQFPYGFLNVTAANALVFESTDKSNPASNIFSSEVDRLNEYADDFDWKFIGVCANKCTVSVAVNGPPHAIVFEIDAVNPLKFEGVEEKKSSKARIRWCFPVPCSIKMICGSGENNTAVLIRDGNVGCVWVKFEDDWTKCPINCNGREQNVECIACEENVCAARTTEGDVFTCTFPRTDDIPEWKKSEARGLFSNTPTRGLVNPYEINFNKGSVL